MTDPLHYPEGAAFNGVIGRTIDQSVPAWPEAARPSAGASNVLIVLLDDVGFAQLGCYGADIRTPTFDRLAANGLRYRDFHTTAICTPSRAALLTGRNHHVNASGFLGDEARGFPGYNSVIPRENGFLSEILRERGYATFALGKWHLTPAWESAPGSPRSAWPLGRGFDRYYGFLGGRTSHYVPDLVYDNHTMPPPKGPEEGYHLNVDMADRAIEFLSDLRAADAERPFFMYYATGAGHSPHHVPPEWADRYRGQFDQGWDSWRETVFARQQAEGIVPPGTRLPARPSSIPAWDSFSETERRLCARQMEVYAGFMEHTDHHIGRILTFLEELGELDNTIVMVASDNGADAAGGRYGRSGIAPESGDVEWLAGLIDRWGDASTDPNYASGWAWAGCTPFQRWKTYVHEGGVTDPLIVHWPRGIAPRGEVREQYVHVVDIAPTVLTLLDMECPVELNGHRQRPIDGVSFAHTFNDPAAPTGKTVQYYEMLSSRAIWSGGWKAVAERGDAPLTEETLAAQRWELYHVAEDPSESVDLAASHPDKLRELIEQWWTEAGRHQVLPLASTRGATAARQRAIALGVARDRYVYYPGIGPIPTGVAADVGGRAHRIRADVVIPDTGAEGVLLAQGGGDFGGYALYVAERRLHYVYAYGSIERTVVRSDGPIPPGAHTFALSSTPDGRGFAVELFIDGKAVGRGKIARAFPPRRGGGPEGLCCGYDGGLPVGDYRAPFRFTGQLLRVVVDLDVVTP